jgi:hypothetical protein
MTITPSLSSVFPELWTQLERLAHELEVGTYADWPALTARLEFLNDPDLIDLMNTRIPGWHKIAAINNGITARHTILVFATCLNLPEYKKKPHQTQSEIQWAALLHDIDKNVSGGRDASHPFRSAAVAVKAMPGLGFDPQPNVTLKEIEGWSELVMSAQHEVNGQVLHDHTNLKEIIEGIHSQWGKETSASRILKAVLFHQSLPTVKDWPNPVLLSDEELRASLTLEDMNVLAPLLIADSDSWNIFDEPRFAYLDELRENITETRKRLDG